MEDDDDRFAGEIFKAAGRTTLVGGNIGRPVTEMVAESVSESWSVLEVSSFQLETIETFRPRIALVLNITPDHLDRHGTFAAYAEAKARITENQTVEDFLVLNGEDVQAQLIAAKTKAQIYWFSANGASSRARSCMASRSFLRQLRELSLSR